MSNPVDDLKKPTRRLPWITAGIGVAALLTASVIAGPSIAAQINPAPTPTVAFVEAEQTGSVNRAPYVSPEDEAAAEAQAQAIRDAQAAAAAAAQQAAEAAAAQAAADAAAKAAASREANRQSNSGGLPAGATVPLNEFGSPDTTKCASGSASNNSAGVAVCD